MTIAIIIAGLEITATAQNVTAAQAAGIESTISRVARSAEKSATKRGLGVQGAIKQHINAAVGFNNKVHGAVVTVSYRNV